MLAHEIYLWCPLRTVLLRHVASALVSARARRRTLRAGFLFGSQHLCKQRLLKTYIVSGQFMLEQRTNIVRLKLHART